MEAGTNAISRTSQTECEQGAGSANCGSPHGPWRIANSAALALALPNAYFAELGLPPMAVRS
jgi:hypothetical protein